MGTCITSRKVIINNEFANNQEVKAKDDSENKQIKLKQNNNNVKDSKQNNLNDNSNISNNRLEESQNKAQNDLSELFNGSCVNLLDKSKSKLQSNMDIKIQLTRLIQSNKNNNVEDFYKIITKIGRGAFGSVYKVLHKTSGLIRAMKIIKKEMLLLQDDDKEFLKEIEILIQTDHAHIIKIFEYFSDDVNYYIIQEFVSGGELYDTISRCDNFSERQAAEIMYQILSAVIYLHSKKIVHRDLKPENILVEKVPCKEKDKGKGKEKLHIKLIDFGTCNYCDDEKNLSLKVGTPYYIAPEVLSRKYNYKVDIWSCGVILYIMLVGYPPFNGTTANEIMEQVRLGKYSLSGSDWQSISKEAKDLIKKMLTYDPDKRLNAFDAIKHVWFNKFRESTSVDQESYFSVLKNIKNFNAREKFQQATLAYIVHFFYTSQELQDLNKIFRELDVNNDGRLTYKELKDGFSKIYGNQISDAQVLNIIEGVDQDCNGYIDYQEFIRVSVNQKKLVNEEYLKLAFNRFDLNQDGKLSKDEILEVLNAADAEYVTDLIKQVDENNDGTISFEEFSFMMQKLVSNATIMESIVSDSPIKKIRKLEENNKNQIILGVSGEMISKVDSSNNNKNSILNINNKLKLSINKEENAKLIKNNISNGLITNNDNSDQNNIKINNNNNNNNDKLNENYVDFKINSVREAQLERFKQYNNSRIENKTIMGD